MMSYDVYVLSSDDSEYSEDCLPPLTFSKCPENKGPISEVVPATKTSLIHEISSSDDDEYLPLFARIAKTNQDPATVVTSNALPPVCSKGTSVSNGLNLNHNYITCSESSRHSHDKIPPVSETFAKNVNPFALSSSDEDDLPDLDSCILPKSSYHNGLSIDSNLKTIPEIPGKPALTKKNSAEVLAKREDLRRQREEKAALLQQEKISRQLQRQKEKSWKPGECIKYVKAILDLTLLEMPEAVDIPRVLTDSEMQYSLQEQTVPRSITWTRQTDENTTDCNSLGEVVSKDEVERQVIVMLPTSEFLESVHHFKQEQSGSCGGNTLVDVVSLIKTSLLHNEALTILICGLQNYFQKQKSKQQRQYRSNVMDNPQPVQPKRARKNNNNSVDVNVSRVDVEEALVDLQIREPCNVRLVDTAADVAHLVASFTKAIAEAPYKQTKDDCGFFNWLVTSDTGQAVKVDKDGIGLVLLWQKQIEQFHNVSTDVAQAIVAEYPSPMALIKAYAECRSPEASEKLLQDIIVRRGVGPLASTRRIGPELSKKLYVLLTSTDGSITLDGN